MEFGELPEYIPIDSELGQLILIRKNGIKSKKTRTPLFSMDLAIEAFFNWMADNWLFVIGIVVALSIILLICI